ncbi:MAG: hypothetical protein Q9183_000508, partial [Haloplaca sp. 2 TL-2023]
LRLNKYLYLMRMYVRASFRYLHDQGWKRELLSDWRAAMEGRDGYELGPLSPGNGKVPDGVRYHVLDVWVDELWVVIDEEDEELPEGVGEEVMGPVERLQREGRTKVVKGRARDVLMDERTAQWMTPSIGKDEQSREEFEGFED